MANDSLFLALANAKSQPSKTLRAVQSAGQAGQDILGGYIGGKEIGQKLAKYRILNTKLGDIFSDPTSIPGGLSPQHTVSDLMQLAPVLPYIPTEAGGSIANMMMGTDSARPTSAPTTPAPATPTPVIPGSQNLAPTPGTTALDSTEGTGVGDQPNIPAGTPINTFGGGTSVAPTPRISKMSLNDIQRYGPLLNDVRQGKQFQQGQNAEESRFVRGQNAEDARFRTGHVAGEVSKLGENVSRIGQLNTMLDQLEPLVRQNSPLPGMGNLQGSAYNALGGRGTPQMKNAASINNISAPLAASLNYELTRRFNAGEAQLLQTALAPSGNDTPEYGLQKLNQMRALVNAMQSGNDQAVRNIAAAVTGGKINLTPQTGRIPPTNSTYIPSNNSSGLSFNSESEVPQNLPKGTVIRVNGRRAVIR